MNDKIINGVWRGPRLTNIQKLCIRSYQDNGHEFHLYTEGPVEGVPSGTIVQDVRPVISKTTDNPTSAILRKIGENYYSDYFRVKLIEQIGGWYVDLDTVCLKPFNSVVKSEYAFVSESRLGSMKGTDQEPVPATRVVCNYLSGCIFKAPAGAPLLRWIINEIEHFNLKKLTNWICLGPEMFQKAIPKFDLTGCVYPPSVFDALNYDEYELFVTGGVKWPPFYRESVAIHLRTSFWQEKYHPLLKPDGVFDPTSLYEQLKSKHGVTNA